MAMRASSSVNVSPSINDASVVVVDVPASKSIAARALVAKEVLGLDTVISPIPDCDDTRAINDAILALHSGATRFDLGNGATSLRFFVALVAATPGLDVVVDCGDQLRVRPLAPLIDALRSIGADISYLENNGQPPLHIRGKKLVGGPVSLSPSISSQFASALTLISPLCASPIVIDYGGAKGVSAPYLEMTHRVLGQLEQRPETYRVETDWSGATFILEQAFLAPGIRFRIPGLVSPAYSLQGDSRVADLFGRLGMSFVFDDEGATVVCHDIPAGVTIREDMSDIPDAVPALAVALCAAGIPWSFCGVSHLRLKECDRIEAVSTGLAQLGFELAYDEANAGTLSWDGNKTEFKRTISEIVIESHSDHRIAMAFASAQAVLGAYRITDPACISKSFPTFRTYI